ncbi:MAG: ROK family protein [Candidatus Nealsonbacteria bacterium]|nr:ROK family protein [Candidatus Nealsonbacteria bacterium]
MEKNIAVAIDLGATNVRMALVSKNGKILKKIKEKTSKTGPSGIVIAEQIKRMLYSLTVEKDIPKLSGIGIGSIGPLDLKKGAVINTPNLPFKFIPLVKPLEKEFNLKVALFNDCRAGVWGEKHFGAGKGKENLVFITISTGLGGGAIVNGHLLLGKDGNAGEIGHMIAETKYNFPCRCKKGYGHWEACASGNNLARFFDFWLNKNSVKKNIHFADPKDIFKAAEKGNQTALKFLDEVGRISARAVSNIIVAYNPELITIGGSVALNNPEFILNPIKKYIEHYLINPEIKITPLGDDLILLGAAACVFWPPV